MIQPADEGVSPELSHGYQSTAMLAANDCPSDTAAESAFVRCCGALVLQTACSRCTKWIRTNACAWVEIISHMLPATAGSPY